MSAATKTDRKLTGPRVSTAVTCPRAAAYQALGVEPTNPPSEQALRYFQRGKDIEAVIRRRIFAELREQGHRPQAEVEIPWPASNPIGVGHADGFIPRARGILEITSTAGADLAEHKAKQAAWYALEHPRAEAASVISVDPTTYVDRVYPIDVSGYEAEIRSTEGQILDAIRDGSVDPCPRVCSTPFDGPAQRCQHRDACFASWERSPADVLLGLDDQLDLLAMLDEQIHAAKGDAAALEARRREIQDELRPWMDPKTEYRSQRGTLVKFSRWEESRFSLSDARKARVQLPDELHAFVSTSTRERWTVKVGEDGPA